MGQGLTFVDTKNITKLELNIYRLDSTDHSYYLETHVLGFKCASVDGVMWGSSYPNTFKDSEKIMVINGKTNGFIDLSQYLDDYTFIGIAGGYAGSKNFFELIYRSRIG